MAESGGRSRSLGRAAVVGWIVLGIIGVLVAPTSEPPSPTSAEVIFGQSPSMHSSARTGTLAFARLLERMEYDVRIHQAAGRPSAEVLMLLEPKVGLGDEEVDALVTWVRDGGRLVYAPHGVSPPVDEPEELWASDAAGDGESDEARDDDEAEEEEQASDDTSDDESIGDRFLLALEEEIRSEPRVIGTATLWDVGRGRAAILEGGAIALSNESLADVGIGSELPWLRVILAGRTSVAFDEGRLGFGEALGVWGMITHSRFATAARLVLMALLLWIVARGSRRVPAQPDPPAGGRDFGEHIDAVADVLGSGGRVRLALDALAAGTRRRLGALVATDRARQLFDAVASSCRGRPSAATVARTAEALRKLEADCGIAGHPEIAAVGRAGTQRPFPDHTI